jgi:zinc protease
MKTATLRTLYALAAALALALPAAAAEGIPARPEDLVFGELKFTVPKAESYRHVLPGGVVAYVVEDHSLPLVDIQLNVRTGAFREAADQPGVAGLTASMLREGGTAKMTPEEFDEKADFIAANLASRGGDTGSSASLDVITSALDEGLQLLFDMVKTPRFDEQRLQVEKSSILEGMKQRNDDPDTILAREWAWLMRGTEWYGSRQLTQAQLDAISRQELIDFHRRTWGAEGLVIQVSGDVTAKDILARLGKHLAGWRATEKSPWPPPPPAHTPAPGLYYAEKDVPQGKISMGTLGLQWQDYGDPAMYAVQVMNDILGGGGFTARLVKRIRSDEGLAYGVGSNFGIGQFWPGVFRVGSASKSETVALAMKIVLEEVEKMKQAPPSEEELRVSKNSFIDTFPRQFESPTRIAATFAQDEILGRPHDYWTHYRERFRAVTAAHVQAAAQKHLRPEQLTMLVVGKWADIAPGDADRRASMKDFHGGKAEQLPLRDPLTLEPIQP